MAETFRAIIELGGKTATGVPVPETVVNALGAGKRPAVTVRIGEYSYRSTIAPMGGAYYIPLAAEHREAAGLAAGQDVTVEVELDTAPREMVVPADLQVALQANPHAAAVFASLSYSNKRRYVLSVEAAKTPENPEAPYRQSDRGTGVCRLLRCAAEGRAGRPTPARRGALVDGVGGRPGQFATVTALAAVHDGAQRFLDNLDRVMVGKRSVGELLLVALLCDGHVLMEDVPGVGKTTLAKAAARSLDCSFRRIQFTPDLLPSDVVGLNYFNQKTQQFELRQGPLFAEIVLADEINRATPRTQAALLEAMEERQITIEGETRRLPRPFLVIATQNPVEQEGTFPLPEAQLDRFLLRLAIGYPTAAEELAVVLRFDHSSPMDAIQPVLQGNEVASLADACAQVRVEESVREYVIAVVRATREVPGVRLGASPRGSLALFRSSQALAAVRGRDYVTPDDVVELAGPILAHRLILDSQARLRGNTQETAVEQAVASLTVPR